MRLNEIKIGGISVPSTAYWILPDGTQYDVEFMAHVSGFLEWLLQHDKKTYDELKMKHKFSNPSEFKWESDLIEEAKKLGWIRFIFTKSMSSKYPFIASVDFHEPSKAAIKSAINLLLSYRKVGNTGIEIASDPHIYGFTDGIRRLRKML